MSPQTGDKIGFSVTVFLAFSVFMVIVSDLMPTKSKNIPIFAIYLICSLGYSTLYIVLSIIVLNMYHQDPGKPVPRWLTKCLFLKPSIMDKQFTGRAPKVLEEKNGIKCFVKERQLKQMDTLENNSEHCMIEILKSILYELRGRNEKDQVAMMEKKPCLSWKQAAIRLDRILFWIFAFVVVLTNSICIKLVT